MGSTGGAQPLHMCGMSKGKQNSVRTLVSRGADIEAIDTYGFTPLHRMASNNLSEGAKALLECGADPLNVGKIGQSPAQVAQSSNAIDVIKVLQDWGKERQEVGILKIVVDGAGSRSSTRNITQPPLKRFQQALNGFADRRVGTRQIRGRNSMEIQFGSKPQLRPTSTGTSPTVFGGLMSQVGTVSTLPRLLPGLPHRQAGSPSDPLGLY